MRLDTKLLVAALLGSVTLTVVAGSLEPLAGMWAVTQTPEANEKGVKPSYYEFTTNGSYSTSVGKLGGVRFKFWPHLGTYYADGSNITFVSKWRDMSHMNPKPDRIVTNVVTFSLSGDNLRWWNAAGTTILERVQQPPERNSSKTK